MKAGLVAVERALADAQRMLPGLEITEPVATLKTAQGLVGAKIEADFIPPGKDVKYHRVHAVVLDGNGGDLIHVLYTARRPDYEQAALKLVLDNLHRGVE